MVTKVLNYFVGINFSPTHLLDSLQNTTKTSILNNIDSEKSQNCKKSQKSQFFGKIVMYIYIRRSEMKTLSFDTKVSCLTAIFSQKI